MEYEEKAEQTGSSLGHPGEAVFQPDTLLVSQYVNARSSQGIFSPEKSLMLAILKDAISSFQEHHAARQGKRKREFDRVRRWLFEPAEDWVFSFDNICASLALDPQYVRSGLRLWLKRNFSAHAAEPIRRRDGKRPAPCPAMARPA